MTADANNPILPEPTLQLIPERGAVPRAPGSFEALLRLHVDLADSQRGRQPISLSLVIDRSGSMSGRPLQAAKEAAVHALSLLGADDAVAVVAFDHRVEVVAPAAPVGERRQSVQQQIESIQPGGNTALYAGWVEGLTQALAIPRPAGLARVVLLSDGKANEGESRAEVIARQVNEALTAAGVSTSVVGFGAHFDEDMMRGLAEAGGGSYSYVEDPSQLADLFETELVELAGLRGRQVRVAFADSSAHLELLGGAPPEGAEPGILQLPALYAGLTRELLVRVHSDGGALPALVLEWDDAQSGERERRTFAVDLPILDAHELAVRPLEADVSAALAQRDFAVAMTHYHELVQRSDFAAAAAIVRETQATVAAWPVGELRTARLADLERMLQLALEGDAVRSRKWAQREVYEGDRGFGRFERDRMLFAARAQRLSDEDQSATGDAAPALHGVGSPRHRLQGPNGEHRLYVVLGDILKVRTEALVNPTNRGLFGSGGVDGAVHRAGGPELTAACRRIGRILEGEAVHTPGFRLVQPWVIHTTTRPWQGGGQGELRTLQSAYRNALSLAARLRVASLSVPAIGTGSYGYPIHEAAEVAVAAVIETLQRFGGPRDVVFVLATPVAVALYRALLERAAAPPSTTAPLPAPLH